MKRFTKSAFLTAVMISTSLAVFGCGSDRDEAGPNGIGGVPGAAVPAVVTPGVIPIGAGAMQITFTGSIYNSGTAIRGMTPGYYPGDNQGGLVIGGTFPAGQVASHNGTSRDNTGSTVSLAMMANQLGNQSVAGVINLSAIDVQSLQYSCQGATQILGLGIDGWSWQSIFYGTIWVCGCRDQVGNCHGVYVNF